RRRVHRRLPGGQRLVLGDLDADVVGQVVEHPEHQAHAERGEVLAPQRLGGGPRRYEDVLLGRDGPAVSALGQVVDGAARRPVTVADGPADGVPAAVEGQQARVVADRGDAGAGPGPAADEGVRG